DQSNKTAVWDANYKGVWHFTNGTTLSATDSTSNANNGTIIGSVAITGQIDGGANFPTAGDRISINSISLSSGVYTISTWFKSPFPTTFYTTLTRGNNDHQVLTEANTRLLGGFDNAGGTGFHSSGFDVSTLSNGWHYLTAATSGSNTVYYIDGNSVGTANWRSMADIISLGNYQGCCQQWGNTDELRISTGFSRSADWIKTEYNNQSSPSTFYSISSEFAAVPTPTPIPSATPPTAGLVGYWKFDENSGTTTADTSGNGNTGTLIGGAAWAVGNTGSAASLVGVDDYVQVGPQASLAMTSTATFSAWIYPTGPGSMATYGGIIVNKEGEYEIARFADGHIQWAIA